MSPSIQSPTDVRAPVPGPVNVIRVMVADDHPLLREGLVDELLLYLAPCLIGHEASGLFNLPELATLDGKRLLQIRDLRQVGEDIRLIARPR